MPHLLRKSLVFCLAMGAAVSANATTEMQVFEGFASSRAVLSERYTTAIAIAEKRQRSNVAFLRVVNATSLCVARVKTGALDLALPACEAAVAAADQLKTNSFVHFSNLSATDIRDIVSANRQVVSSMQSALIAAQR
ncbi:MAG: hypothetical protein AAGH76_00365 [Pseudomonadota bacterium]